MSAPRFSKTARGRDEIRSPALGLSRPARNLLLIIDATRTGEEWLRLVAGATEADLQGLLERGLVEAAAATPPAPAAPPPLTLEAASFKSLYDYLTAQAKPRLGLVNGYRMVLEIERCTDVAALRDCALRFVDKVREKQGDAAARQVQQELAALR